MAAYAALTSLINIIHQIEHHPSPPISVDKKQATSLTKDATFLQAFLEGYKSPAAYTDEADPLEMRIADVAYAAEDMIESHVVDVIQLHRFTMTSHQISHFREETSTSGFNFFNFIEESMNYRGKYESPLSLYQDLGKVIEEMKLIKKDVMNMKKEKSAVVEGHMTAAAGDSSSRSSIVVGFDDIILEILDKLTGGHNNLQVIPIVGMAGIGKTTLVKTVFENAFTKEHFDVCAWATISQHYNKKEILSELLSQANRKGREEFSYTSEGELELELHKYLSYRRFLIVLDDMWNVEAWEKIQHSFPDNNNSSRIVVTTRLSNLASRLNNIYCLKMKFLDEGSSWVLLSKHVFGEESRPLELEQIGKDIVENCRGLPLSIVVLGGLLKKMERTNQCWESVRKNSSSLVNSENEDFCLKILKMSYNHLPVHLKPCFLYMGVFEIDRVVRVSTLVKLWVSEGFLKPISGKSLEMVAKEYLNDLVDRNLILVHELGSTGNIKFCKLHDLLRDLCWREAAKEGFYNVVGPHNFGGLNRQRRVVIPGSTSKEDAHDTLLSVPLLLARSFICDSSTEVLPLPESRLLRAFKAYDRDRSGSHDYLLDDVFRFVNLSYIAVGVHHESNFPPSLNLLWNLHTLVIFNSVGFSAPKEIWKMPQLRHVEFLKGDLRFPAPKRESGSWKVNFVVMKNLLTLKGVSKLMYPASTIIPNIKKLGVTDGSLLRSHNMTKLESYRCWGIRYVVERDFPRSLKKLSLGSNTSHFALDIDMLENIGTLPFLEKLKLTRARFLLERWETSEDRFLSLKFLEMNCCLLLSWITESSHFPRLEKLRLFGMNELKEVPPDIGDIPTLESIHLEYCSETAVVSAKNIAKEQEEVRVRVVLFNNIYNKYLRSLSSPNFLVEFVDF